jgi:hypothetical protein
MVEEEDIAATSEQEFWPLGEQGEGLGLGAYLMVEELQLP